MNFPTDPDPDDDSAPLDGSAAAAVRALARLAALAGQPHAQTPVLELQVGDIVTRTCVDSQAGAAGGAQLTVCAQLPPGLPADGTVQAPYGIEGMWHADEGCHVALRRIPLAGLRSERALMDAVLETADAAQAWQAALEGRRPA
ncbi:hypothetical protein IP92_05480 [Pseudoduganella flava]|uniref:Uncharacterized protein n=1 Tax=Pseudoduganella flava TaxID=871742 RepID=A0A562PDJ0_9BURK|nr:hypothetical protein [Pseudoduganella flava]QGZ42125.1 hypothetical protein GO485_25825 [Pseudoduganella flava]TWI42504.1 hypothetical protein IP92_05480 [Pseudoduganella flava]